MLLTTEGFGNVIPALTRQKNVKTP